jgi:hypothetical protein
VFTLFGFSSIEAQWYGSNTFEYQLGNLPYEQDSDYSTSYNQTNLYFDSGNFSLSGKLEQFYTPNEERNYFDLTQRRVQFQDDQFRVRVGNFYETLGRGLLLRSYDIPGSVFEDEFERTRYAFFRDLEGVAIDFISDRFEIKAVRAQPLFNPLPPNFKPDSLRRPDLVEAIQANLYATDDLNIGAILMRSNSNTSDFREFGSLLVDYNLSTNIQLFSEYAFDIDNAFSFDKDADAFGLYAGSNFYYGGFGGSLEFKNYSNLRLGSGYNDPPSLIKEHTYPVLNRSTHVLDTAGETGFQAEVYYNFDDGHNLTLNWSRAVNDGFVRFEYSELFLEGLYQINDDLSIKSFFDYAQDDLKGENDRISVGLITENIFDNNLGTVVDLQYQQFKRPFDPDQTSNIYAAISLSFSSELVISGIVEATTDPQLTDNPTSFVTIEDDTRYWVGGNALYKANENNTFEIFAGKRRGGPACTSGICYEILDFEGVEIRLTTRF